MPIGNDDTFGERELDKIDSELFYSPSLDAVLKLILGDAPISAGAELPKVLHE